MSAEPLVDVSVPNCAGCERVLTESELKTGRDMCGLCALEPGALEAYYADLNAQAELDPQRNGHARGEPSAALVDAAVRRIGHARPAESRSFAARVTSHSVDLVQRYRDGGFEIEFLQSSDGMFVRGKRHHMPAPKKVGKSIAGLNHSVDMALAGAVVVIFDRENGGNLYADRLGQIMTARGLSEAEQDQLARRIRYYEFPRFRDTDEHDLVELCADADLVIFDSQRKFLSDLGLEESGNDDYSDFMSALIDPLFLAGVATLVLDNSGHHEPKRGRGASAKGDLNEINFTLETVERFNLDTTGRIRLEIHDSRFGTTGRWEMEIGGGVFGSWRRIDDTGDDEATGFRPTGQMERASIFIENCSDRPSRRTVTDTIPGKTQYKRVAIDCLVREGYVRGPKGEGLESIKPYREATDPHRATTEDKVENRHAKDDIPW